MTEDIQFWDSFTCTYVKCVQHFVGFCPLGRMSLEWLCINGKFKRTIQFDTPLLKIAKHLT
jgi:hypothetical protein